VWAAAAVWTSLIVLHSFGVDRPLAAFSGWCGLEAFRPLCDGL